MIYILETITRHYVRKPKQRASEQRPHCNGNYSAHSGGAAVAFQDEKFNLRPPGGSFNMFDLEYILTFGGRNFKFKAFFMWSSLPKWLTLAFSFQMHFFFFRQDLKGSLHRMAY